MRCPNADAKFTFPQLLDRLPAPDIKLEALPALRVPPPTEVQAPPAAPIPAPLPQPLPSVPAPLLQPLPAVPESTSLPSFERVPEIRAPAGSLPGVSGFQLNFSSHDIRTPGDQPNVLVAMNPAALKVNLPDLEEGGTMIINTDEFTKENLEHAAYKSNPLEDGSLTGYRVHMLPISTLNMNALKGTVELSRKEIARCKNFFALGVLYWLYDRPLDPTLNWINSKFRKNPELAKANEVALKTGYNFAETTEVFTTHYTVKKAVIAPEGDSPDSATSIG